MVSKGPWPLAGPGQRPGQGMGAEPPAFPLMSVRLSSLILDHALFRVFWGNFGVVVPGRVYRSSHPLPFRLRWAVRRHGIRTVVNLRGAAANPSTSLSAAAAGRLGIDHVFMAFESRGAPQRERILRFHAIYREIQFPALLHCKSGADRAGLAAGLVVLFEGGTAAAAARQLTWRHGHIAASPTGILDGFFRLYAAEGEGRKSFLDWVREDYREEDLQARFRARGFFAFLNDRVLRRE